MSERQGLLNNMADLKIRNEENENLNGNQEEFLDDSDFEVDNDSLNGNQQDRPDADLDVEMREMEELIENPPDRFILQGPLHGQYNGIAGHRPFLGIGAASNAQEPLQNQQNGSAQWHWWPRSTASSPGAADGAQGPLQAQRNDVAEQEPLVVGQGAANGARRRIQGQQNGIAGNQRPLQHQRAAAGARRPMQGQRNGFAGQRPLQPQRAAAGERRPLQNLNNNGVERQGRNAGGRQQDEADHQGSPVQGNAREELPLRNQAQNGMKRGKRGVRGGRKLRKKIPLNPYQQGLKNVAELFLNMVEESTNRTRARLEGERELRERELAEAEEEDYEQEEEK
ncbi:uncharacterized protein LOC116417818 [Nasonia vitripennis]|uniref:Uncharacterized protein n=1 Tax=Nasonia vitripennis TaxID=7425 RepID=A0A7M7QPA3_NASVI|nr:uncharacterized protein LOC116417818 [Nasonia vitripennis]